MYIWIKQVVIITDHRIRKQAHIQRHLKRTDHKPLRILQHSIPVKAVPFLQKCINGIIDPAKMPFRIRAVHRIAAACLHWTYLLFCGQQYCFIAESVFCQN